MNSTYTAPRRLIKTPDEIEKMRIAGRLAAEVLDMIKPHIKAGVSTLELDTICRNHIECTARYSGLCRLRWCARTPCFSTLYLYFG